MSRSTKLRPWQFSLRFLLAVTALVAVGAAFFGWRARQLEAQRHAASRIAELGGAVELEEHAWLEAIRRGCDTEEVVGVTLPGNLVDEALADLKTLRWLRRLTITYHEPVNVRYTTRSGAVEETVERLEYYIGGWYLNAADEDAKRRGQVEQELPGVDLQIKHVAGSSTAS